MECITGPISKTISTRGMPAVYEGLDAHGKDIFKQVPPLSARSAGLHAWMRRCQTSQRPPKRPPGINHTICSLGRVMRSAMEEGKRVLQRLRAVCAGLLSGLRARLRHLLRDLRGRGVRQRDQVRGERRASLRSLPNGQD